MAAETSMPSAPPVAWARADAYEAYVGRWSRPVARAFLAWLDQPAGLCWLDVGCGTGALTETILARADPTAVVGVDPSTGFVDHARANVGDPRAAFVIGDARRLPVASAAVEAAVSGLVLNHLPADGHGTAASEMVRAVRPGGVAAAYVWDYAEGMRMMRIFWDAAVALDPAARPLDAAVRSPLCHPEPLAALFRGAGLTGVETRAIEVATHFRDFDDYWTPFLGGEGPAPAYVTTLAEGHRDALRDRIRAGLPFEADGSIRLSSRAWAVRGTVADGTA